MDFKQIIKNGAKAISEFAPNSHDFRLEEAEESDSGNMTVVVSYLVEDKTNTTNFMSLFVVPAGKPDEPKIRYERVYKVITFSPQYDVKKIGLYNNK